MTKFGVRISDTEIKPIDGEFSCIEDVHKLLIFKIKPQLKERVVQIENKPLISTKRPLNRWAVVFTYEMVFLESTYNNRQEVARNVKCPISSVVYIPKSAYHPKADKEFTETLATQLREEATNNIEKLAP